MANSTLSADHPRTISARGLEPLDAAEHAVLMHMSGELGYTAGQIAADLACEHPDAGWTEKGVSNCRRSLRAKGYADFGPLVSEDDGLLRGRGYWLSAAGCDLRYGRSARSCG